MLPDQRQQILPQVIAQGRDQGLAIALRLSSKIIPLGWGRYQVKLQVTSTTLLGYNVTFVSLQGYVRLF